jgi:RHS repeat-associated protein
VTPIAAAVVGAILIFEATFVAPQTAASALSLASPAAAAVAIAGTPSPTVPPASAPTAEPLSTPAPSAALPDPSPSPQSTQPETQPDALTGLEAGATELVSARTEYSQTYVNPDGTKTTQFFAEPVFYKPADSTTFEPISVGFNPGVTKGVDFVSSAAPVTVAISDSTTSGNDFLSTTYQGRSIGFGLPTDLAKAASTVRPTASGPVADYVNLLPGVDLRVIANAHGAKSFFIWRAAPSDPTLRYVVDAPELKLTPQSDGSMGFFDSTGVMVASIPRPYAVDSTPDELTGSGRLSDAVTLSLGADGKTITVAVDPEWLKTAVYPVYVDPSTGWVYNAGSSSYGDAFVDSHSGNGYDDYQDPTSPFYHELWNGVSPADAGVTYDFLRWDLSAYANVTVDSATLRLYPWHQYYNAPTTETTYVRRLTTSWTEGGVTWANKPSYTATNTATTACVEGSYCNFDVSAIAQLWLQATSPLSNYGFQVDTIGKNDTYWKRFISSEQGGSNRPALSITYHNASATASAKPAFTGARTFGWTYSDSGGDPQTSYEVQLSSDGGATWPAGLDSGIIAGSATTWTAPSSIALLDLTAYTWHVRVSNGTSWSPYSASSSFTYDAYERGNDGFYTKVPFDLGGGWSLGVGVHNGEASLGRTLYSIPTVGPSGDLELAYNSTDLGVAGAFGYGWSSNLTQHLWLNNASTPTLILWIRPDGGRVAFSGSGSTWSPVAGHFESLAYVGSPTNEYTVTEKDQSKLVFESAGAYRLKRIVDRFGKTLTLTYPSGSIIATDALGRTTTIALDGSGHADTVTDVAGRAWDVTVSTSTADLSSITEPDPDGAGTLTAPVSTFAYATHQLTSVTRHRRTAAGGDDTVVWSVGYTSGKVTSVIDPIAHANYADVANTFTYNSGNTIAAILKTYSPAVRNSTTYAYDTLGRVTTTTDPLTHQTTFAWNNDSTLHSVIDPNLVKTDYAYSADGHGNLLTSTADVTGSPIVTKYDYNGSNDVTKTYDAYGSPDEVDTTLAYDTAGLGASPGHVISVTQNSSGVPPAVTQYVYNANDEVSAELNPDGVTTTHAYDANGNETATVTNCTNTGTTPPGDPAWKTCAATGTHDASTNVTTSAVYTLGSVTGKLGLPDSTSDGVGQATSYLYDSLGRTTSETPPAGTTSHDWDQFGNEIKTTTPGPLVTTRTLDLMNRITIEVGPVSTTMSAYDAIGSMTSRTTAGNTVSSTYDGAGNLLSQTIDPGSAPHLNLVTEHAYDSAGRGIAVRRPAPTLSQADLKTITRTWYDAQGRVTKVVENCTNVGTTIPDAGWESCAATGTHDATWNLTATKTYDDRGNKIQETAPNGRVTTYTYDDLDRLIKQVDNDVASPSGPTQDVTTEYALDANGNQTAVKSPSNVGGATGYMITRTLFDNLGRPIETIANCTNSGTTPPGDPAWRTCAGTGTADSSTNIITTVTYDAANRQISVTGPDPSATTGTSSATTTTRNAYDSAGRLCRVLEHASVDLQSLTIPCSDAVSGTPTANVSTRYSYDAAGNLATMIDGNGHTTIYGYDATGRMTSLQDALAATLGWAFDDVSRTKTQTNRTDSTPLTPTITWTYDAAGRLVSRAYLDDAGSGRTTTYTYDLAGNLVTAVDASSTITIVNDRIGRPTSVTVAGDSGATTSYAYSFTAPTRTDASGAYTMAVDPFGDLTSMTDPIHASPFTWAYGGDSQPMTATAPNGNSTTLTYDPLGRVLSKVTGARASYAYTYNRAGNRLTETSTITGDPANGTATFGYDPLARLSSYSLPGIRTLGDTWQAVPNRDSLTTDGIPSTQGFDAANRENTNGYAFDADGRMTARPGTSGGWLEWDSLGRLVRVRASQGGAVVAAYTYDALDRLLTVDRSGTRIRFRYEGTGTAVAQVVDDISGTVIRNVAVGPDGVILEDWLGSSHRIYGANAHYDTTWTADDSGAVTATLRYDPWGNLVRSTGTAPDWRFQSSWVDSATGLSWAVARWYAPTLGRFISEDTLLGVPQSPSTRNLYEYGAGDPTDRVDRDGQWPYELNPTEQRLCNADWWRCVQFKSISAFAFVTAYFGYSDPKRNSIRHCVWQCLLRNAQGYNSAWLWGWAHETTGNSAPYYDEMVDLRNNWVGRYLGQYVSRFWWQPADVTALYLCEYAWNQGWLWQYLPGWRYIHWSDGRVIYSPYFTWS